MIDHNQYKSANDNTIYVCKDEDILIWKLSIDLLKKSMVVPIFDDYYYQINSPLNETGYVLVWFEDGCYENSVILYEALKFYKVDFKFDESTLQEVFDALNEDEKENAICHVEESLSDVGISSDLDFPDDLVNHFYNIFAYREWGVYACKYIECEEDDTFDMDLHLFDFAVTLKENEIKQNKIEKKVKQRRTKYKNMGCKILKGSDAITEIDKSYTHSMIAIDTDDIYSIEFNREQYYASDYPDESIFTVRKFENGKLVKKAYWWFLLQDLIHRHEWAIKEYHSDNDEDLELCPYN